MLQLTPSESPTKSTTDQVTTEHLLYLLEKQPSCLIRAAVDGTLLAVNDAALGLLGVETHAQALGRNLASCIPAGWTEFATRVWGAGSGSLDCELIDLIGAPKNVCFQGIALRDHPDRLHSILLTARDTTVARTLESGLQHQEAARLADEQARALAAVRAELAEARTRLAQLELTRQQEIEAQRVRADGAAADAQELQKLAERHQLELMLKDRDSRKALEHAQRELAAAVAERDRLRGGIEGSTTDRADLERALEAAQAERRVVQQALEAAETESRRLDQERCDLERALGEAREQLRELQTTHEQHVAAGSALESELQARIAEAQAQLTEVQSRLVAALSEHTEQAEAHSRAVSVLGQVQEERARLEELLAEAAEHHARATAELRAALEAALARAQQAEDGLEDGLADRDDLAKLTADQQIELDMVHAQLRALEPLAAAGRLMRNVGNTLIAGLMTTGDRAQLLLAHTALDDAYRHEVESLHADALAALSLARQMMAASRLREE